MQKEILDTEPWYKQFWPWFIIALPLTAVIASVATLLIAINNPDYIVLEKSEYKNISAEMLPAQKTGISSKKAESGKPD